MPHHFDDPEEGLARETSHPRFVALATDDFYYDLADDFSPFGSDDGSDTLSLLEDWYRDGGKNGKVASFLKEMLADWDFGVPKSMHRVDADVREKWLAKEDMHETYLQSECRARVATAFGQLKITGEVDPAMRDEALAAIACQLALNERARTHHPAWPHADENEARLTSMRAVLSAL
ncbi:MolR family transcriptional regulator [Variovorax sp. 38R]|uniref:MolR family transcriptional regulator n=1 Tax=Variovorax sp. 38R TaxID=2774875 RepID=UPI0017800234|nr:MolR family transcriptional regulator [Variovorax sp. 38R]QOF81123.1 MolR family transcriptional regulator [Variovorax sp. 38R]